MKISNKLKCFHYLINDQYVDVNFVMFFIFSIIIILLVLLSYTILRNRFL